MLSWDGYPLANRRHSGGLCDESVPSYALFTLTRVPVVDGVRQIQRIAVRNAEVGAFRSTARCQPERRTVGAWCFLDHAGPTVFSGTSSGMDVGPHPHIGLQTFTWMIEGEVLHRDSLGSEQVIRPGQVNLMTAGHGIAHTEQSVGEPRRLHAAQLWIALPAEHADMAPRFDHYPDLPQWQNSGVNHRLLVGEFGAYRSPVFTLSPLIAIDMEWQEAATVQCRCAMTMKSASCP